MYELLNLSALCEEQEAQRRAEEAEARKAEAESAAEQESDEPQTVWGWTASPRQITLIRAGDRAAVDKFFKDNYKRLKACAYKYLQGGFTLWGRERVLLDVDDLINQVYVDMRCGYLLVELEHMGKYVYHSFQYALVGGFGDEKGAYTYHPRKKSAEVTKCQLATN